MEDAFLASCFRASAILAGAEIFLVADRSFIFDHRVAEFTGAVTGRNWLWGKLASTVSILKGTFFARPALELAFFGERVIVAVKSRKGC